MFIVVFTCSYADCDRSLVGPFASVEEATPFVERTIQWCKEQSPDSEIVEHGTFVEESIHRETHFTNEDGSEFAVIIVQGVFSPDVIDFDS